MSDDGEHVERERRQLVLMLQRIEVFRQNYLSLGRLIADLEGLLAARQRVSEKWIDDFRSAWGDLDIPYAVALDRLAPIPDAHDPVDGLLERGRLVRPALDELS